MPALIVHCPIPVILLISYEYNYYICCTTGVQRGEGLAGPLIVREPSTSDPQADLYDYDLSEHVVFIHDWTETNGLDKYLEFAFGDGNNIPDDILVNGKGRHQEFTGDDEETIYTPTERFVVVKVCEQNMHANSWFTIRIFEFF